MELEEKLGSGMYLRKAPRKCPCVWFPSRMAQPVKNLPAVQEMRETQVRALGQEAPLEDEMATYSRILAWRIPWAGEPGGLQSMGSQRVEYNWRDLACTHRKWVVCNKWSKLLLQVFINRWTDKENIIHTCNGMAFNLKKKGMNSDMLQHEWTLKIC